MKYKTFEELKEELRDKFEEYMYKANIELLTKIDKAIEILEQCNVDMDSIWLCESIDYAIYTLKGELNNE